MVPPTNRVMRIRANTHYFRTTTVQIYKVKANSFRPPTAHIPWDKFKQYLHLASHTIMPTPSDGFCYLNAVQQCLALDHKKFYGITQLQSLILTHLLHNHDKYQSFHDGDICKDTHNHTLVLGVLPKIL